MPRGVRVRLSPPRTTSNRIRLRLDAYADMLYCLRMGKSKYTNDSLADAVRTSVSVAGVCRVLGISLSSSSMQTYISRRIKKFGLDTSHFLGRAANRGEGHVGGPDKLHWSEILVLDRKNGLKEKTEKLRRAMIESGILHKCVKCGLGLDWPGAPIVHQIEHKKGNRLDNRKDNVVFVCPNCHRQTPTYGRCRRTLSGG